MACADGGGKARGGSSSGGHGGSGGGGKPALELRYSACSTFLTSCALAFTPHIVLS